MQSNVRSTAILLLLLLLPLAALAASSDVRFASTSEIEVQQLNAKGETITVRQPAVLVPPGTVVIYTNTFVNTGKEPKENLVVTNPVPEKSEYIAGSAESATADVVYSVDGGKSYAKAAALTVADGKGGKRPATAKDFTHIRWTVKAPLKPGMTGLVEFRARVK